MLPHMLLSAKMLFYVYLSQVSENVNELRLYASFFVCFVVLLLLFCVCVFWGVGFSEKLLHMYIALGQG